MSQLILYYKMTSYFNEVESVDAFGRSVPIAMIQPSMRT